MEIDNFTNSYYERANSYYERVVDDLLRLENNKEICDLIRLENFNE
jgi:hypothetical protein